MSCPPVQKPPVTSLPRPAYVPMWGSANVRWGDAWVEWDGTSNRFEVVALEGSACPVRKETFVVIAGGAQP